MTSVTHESPAVKSLRSAPLDDAPLPEALEPSRRVQPDWPQVLAFCGTPATGADLLEWPSRTGNRGRYIVRRYDDYRITARHTFNCLKEARTMHWHLSTPLTPTPAALSDDHSGAFGFAPPEHAAAG